MTGRAIVLALVLVAREVIAAPPPPFEAVGEPAEWFDDAYYATANPDVVAVVGTWRQALWFHYVLWGQHEGRQPNATGVMTPTFAFDDWRCSPVAGRRVDALPYTCPTCSGTGAFVFEAWARGDRAPWPRPVDPGFVVGRRYVMPYGFAMRVLARTRRANGCGLYVFEIIQSSGWPGVGAVVTHPAYASVSPWCDPTRPDLWCAGW